MPPPLCPPYPPKTLDRGYIAPAIGAKLSTYLHRHLRRRLAVAASVLLPLSSSLSSRRRRIRLTYIVAAIALPLTLRRGARIAATPAASPVAAVSLAPLPPCCRQRRHRAAAAFLN